MYNFLIVEDEPRQLRALTNIIRQLRPNYVVNQAVDGLQALEFINHHAVDVVITDIRMPEMDGMQLIEALYDKKHAAKIILCTGYGEFEYAQKAIKMGIFDYFVKPTGKSDIERLLVKVEKKLEEEQIKLKETEYLEKKLVDSFPIFMTYLLNKWVGGSLIEKERLELEQSLNITGPGIAFIAEFTDPDQWGTKPSFEGILKAYLNPMGQSVSFVKEGHRERWITIVTLSQLSKQGLKDLIACLNKLIIDINSENNVELTIGTSRITLNIFTDAKQAYEEALTSLERKFFYGLGKVIVYSEANDRHKSFNLQDKEEELSAAIRKSDIETISLIINGLFQDIDTLIHIEPEQIKEELVRVTLNQSKVIKHLVAKPYYDQFISTLRLKLMRCKDYRELRHDAKNILFEIVDLLHTREDNNSLIIQQCQKYIETHYHEDISLDFLAQRFHFNASYFSNLFKSHAGISLSEYLVKVRMKKAHELLVATDYKISEIALKVGYKDAAYFIRMFKREMGLSPNKFRQVNG